MRRPASIVIIYWLAKDGRNATRDATDMAGLLLAMPAVATVYALMENAAIMGIKTLIEKAKQQIRDEGRAEGRAEGLAERRAEDYAQGLAQGRAEYEAWLKRRTARGTFVWDDDDPPPGKELPS